MSYKMWKKGRTTDYSFIDRNIAEQYNIGGVDMWLYAYVGPKQLKSSDDDITYQNGEGQSDVSKIGDIIFGETAQREYNLEAITLSAVYQVQEATPDLKMPGIFFNFNTMDITVHYNTMMQRVGRKIMPGDVLELPNLRDFDVIGKDTGLNRFYVVQDSFRTSEGYSATWQHHIFKLRVKPLTDSPEYSGILDNNNYPDDPNDPNNGNGNSSTDGGSENSNYNNEMDIMNKIIIQADDEVPYIHWTNEHIYDDRSDIWDLARVILNGYEFPPDPSPDMFFIKKTYPVLYEKEYNTWSIVEVDYGTTFPRRPKDGEFFFKEQDADVSGFTLFQYNKDLKRWMDCDLPYTKEDTVPGNADDFYVLYHDPQLYQVLSDGKTWVIPPDEHSNVPFTSKTIAADLTMPEDMRPKIPPARGTVGEGTMFPDDPSDGEYYYRTDYTPVTLWEYSDDKKSWVQFNYGGRQPWTGADKAKTDFLNSPDRVPLEDAVKPNIVYRVHKK